jgi:hypothetical protein
MVCILELEKKEEKLVNSIQQERLNCILDKIRNNEELSNFEQIFLSKFDLIKETDYLDFTHLTKNQVFEKISTLLSDGKIVYCDLFDKNGKINEQILSITNDYESDNCILYLKHNEKTLINDNFFYRLIFNGKKNIYSLESHDEFYEKINIGNED